jgi:hypothetical protein
MNKHLICVQSGEWYDESDHYSSMKKLIEYGFEAIDFNIDHVLSPSNYLKGEEYPIAKLPLDEFVEYFRPLKGAAESAGAIFS